MLSEIDMIWLARLSVLALCTHPVTSKYVLNNNVPSQNTDILESITQESMVNVGLRGPFVHPNDLGFPWC